jgi:hypothetical protein
MDDDGDMKPPQASELTGKQLQEELVSRGLKPSGFPEDDMKTLQKIFNAEFEAEKETKMAERREALKKRRAEEEALKMQRILEKQKREEEEAVAQSPLISLFIDQLKSNTTAPDLVLREKPTAIRAFVKAAIASNNTSMHCLDVIGCNLGDDVGVEIGALIRVNKGLKKLDLDQNLFGPKTLAAISLGLQSNNTLQTLSIEHNRLTGEAQYSQAAVAAAADEAEPGATKNPIKDEYLPDLTGIAALTTTLKEINRSLSTLNLFQTGVTETGGHLIADALVENTSLKSVLLSSNDGINAVDFVLISSALDRNISEINRHQIDGKAERAQARRDQVRKEMEETAKSANEAEERWIQNEKDQRKRVRDDAEFEAYRKARLAALERENQEKLRKERLKAEAEEAAKKAKKK